MLTDLSAEQQDALDKVQNWLKNGEKDVFCLYGYAGTGKTSLALRIAEMVGNTAFAAYTGKAALALQAKGCIGASTIHRLIYRASPVPDGSVQFLLREPEELTFKLIIVDECSMVDEELLADLRSFGRPILAMGDPHQLPPISGRSFFEAWRADVYLREVHRQAVSNPIIAASATLRAGYKLGLRDDAQLKVICLEEVTVDMFIKADQIIVGRNETRDLVNNAVRRLRGFSSPYPQVGDRLVCLRSNRSRGLINGGLWEVVAASDDEDDKRLALTVQSLDDLYRPLKRIRVLKRFFDGDPNAIKPSERQRSDEFGYSYALTAHKAQGSQWRDVLVIDEGGVCDEPTRWMYTAITRASERATVVYFKRLVRQRFARASNRPMLPGDQDVVVEKAIIDAFFMCALERFYTTTWLAHLLPSASESLQLKEDIHPQAKDRVKQAAMALYDRGALTWPSGVHGHVVLNGQHLSPALRAMIVERWKPVARPDDEGAIGTSIRQGPRGRRKRGF